MSAPVQKSEVNAADVDFQYLALCERILTKGKLRQDRTGVGVYSLFGERLDIDISENFPLLTTKKIFWKGVVAELLWFISGSTDSTILSKQGVHIWDGNTSREALDKLGLTHYDVGEVGPSYGWQWRHFGGTYQNPFVNGGKDQLGDVIKRIKLNPTDRRLIVSAWNPIDVEAMALPPCHIMYQFYVDGRDLSCQMYQRSCDVGLGLPFNIASYALLTYMVAHVCKLRPARLILCLGDTHIYTNHIDGIREQMLRPPTSPPKVYFKRNVNDIDDFYYDDIVLASYHPQPKLTHSMPMAV